MNRAGATPVPEKPLPIALTPTEVAALVNAGAIVLDVRGAAAFGTAHVPGSLNIGLNGQFASWSGTLVPPDRGVIIVAEGEDEVREAAVRLARVGVERVLGYLAGGIAAWERAGLSLASLAHVTVTDLHERMAQDPDLQVIDVRRPAEYVSGHLPRAVNLPLDRLSTDHVPLDPIEARRRRLRGWLSLFGGFECAAAAWLSEPPERSGRNGGLDQGRIRDAEGLTCGGPRLWAPGGRPYRSPSLSTVTAPEREGSQPGGA